MTELGAPVLGCCPLYPPLELLDALGVVPRVLWGRRDPAAEHAGAHLQPFVCAPARGLLERVLAAEPALDGLLWLNACDTLRNLPEIAAAALAAAGRRLPAFRLHLPQIALARPEAARLLRQELTALVAALEEWTGRRLERDAFRLACERRAAIAERARRLAEELAAGRLGFDAYCDLLDPDRAEPPAATLARLDAALEACRAAAPAAAPRGRVLVSGLLPPRPALARALEAAGLRVVADDMAALGRCLHSRPPALADPLAALERWCAEHRPCPTLLASGGRRLDSLRALAGDAGAQAVVFLTEKFCDPEALELPWLQQRLRAEGLAVLALEVGPSTPAAAAGARFEALAEMLAGGAA